MKLKYSIPGLMLLSLLAIPGSQAGAPEPCSISVAIVPRTGLILRTWTNALETEKLRRKGFTVCQDDSTRHSDCKAEFHLEILYLERDPTIRNVSIYKGKQEIFSKNFSGNLPSQKMLKTIPSCAALSGIGTKSSIRAGVAQ